MTMTQERKEEVERYEAKYYTGINSKIIKPKRLSQEELTKQIAERKEARDRRDEGGVLIPEVPQCLKNQYADEIKAQQKTSQAFQSWKRIVKKKDRPSLEEVQGNWDNWWKTDSLISVAKKGLKADAKKRRKQKVKDFFYTATGLKYLKNLNWQKKEEAKDKAIVQEFLDDIYPTKKDSYYRMPDVLADFLCFIYGRKGFRGFMTTVEATKLAIEFIGLNRIKEEDINPDNKTLLAFYKFWREK